MQEEDFIDVRCLVAWSRPKGSAFRGVEALRLEIEMPKMGGRIHRRQAGPAQVILPQGDPLTRPSRRHQLRALFNQGVRPQKFLFVTLPGTETHHDFAQESIVQ
jgi:hypothetical protein